MRVWNEDVSNTTVESFRQEARERHLLFRPTPTLKAWRSKREELLKTIESKAGAFPPSGDLAVETHGVIACRGYEIRKITYRSRPGVRVTANLYVPEGKGPFPAVLNVHGHHAQGKIAPRVQARGHVLASRGFVTLSVDAFGAGERATTPGRYEYHGAGIGAALFDIGETLLGMQVVDNRRAIDLLASLPFVDGERIGVTGASGGGNQTMWVSALDERVKAAVPVVSVGTFESYIGSNNCVCEVLPDGLTFMEEWAVLALVAPNALLMLNSLRDSPCFSVREMLRSFNDAREIFRLYDVPDKISYQAIDLPHGYWDEMLSAMLGWFQRWLKEEGDGRPARLPDYETLPEEQCLCFPDLKRPKEVCSIVEYVLPRAGKYAAAHLESTEPLSRETKLKQLKETLRVNEPGETPVSEILAGPDHQRPTRIFSLQSAPGIHLPVVIEEGPGKAAPVSIVVHPGGKEAAANEPFCRDLAAAGGTLCLVDIRNTGETRFEPPNGDWNAVRFHYHFRWSFWLGRTMLGEWTTDLLAVLKTTAAVFPGRPMELVAFDETGLAALAAAAISGRVKVRAIRLPGSCLARGRPVSRSMAVYVPHLLECGDTSMLAALVDGDVEIINPVDRQWEPYDSAMARNLQSEIHALAARFGLPKRAKVTCTETAQ